MKKILASDLDGTLIQNDVVPNYNVYSLHNFKNSGGMFIIATGRPYNGVSELIEKYNLEVDYNVLLNGALIIDKFDNIIHHKTIPFDIIEEITYHVGDFNPKLSFETGFKTYTLGDSHENLPYDKKETIYSIDTLNNEKISLISMYFGNTPIEIIDKITNSINTLFNSYCVAYRNTNYIDIVPIGCSKGSAIDYIFSSMNMDYSNLYTIGDSLNDISMFDITKNSFTFHNSEGKLKEYVSNLVSSVSECIEDYII